MNKVGAHPGPMLKFKNSRTHLIRFSHRALLIILILDHISCLGLKAIWCVAEVAKTCVPGPSRPSMTGPLAESARSICKDASRHVKLWQCWKEGPSVFVKMWVCFRTHQSRNFLGGVLYYMKSRRTDFKGCQRGQGAVLNSLSQEYWEIREVKLEAKKKAFRA